MWIGGAAQGELRPTFTSVSATFAVARSQRASQTPAQSSSRPERDAVHHEPRAGMESYALERSAERRKPLRSYAGPRLLARVVCLKLRDMSDSDRRPAANVHWQAIALSREERARSKNQRAAVLWLTGISGAGKSSLANLVETRLAAMQRHTFLLDGDNVRHGLNRDLGFSAADRIENIRRIGEVAKLMTDAGLIVITAFISPFRAERDLVRSILQPGEFFEIFVDTPIEVAEARDVKGLYRKARSGELENFTGIDSPYEAPLAPELRIDTTAIVALLDR